VQELEGRDDLRVLIQRIDTQITDRHTGRQTDRQTDKQTDRQAGREQIRVQGWMLEGLH
jgi:hypothetical protein